MENPLISVIVPVYKVEPYLRRCVDSIIKQDYQNIEIILVDDGSPDRCGQICDEYAFMDNRIKVIHRQNGGLSAARNSGLDICSGEYIGFVDSDDCIHPEMYSRLYQDIVFFNTRLAFCHCEKFTGEIPHGDISLGRECRDKDYVMERSMSETIWWSAWAKLYHRSLFNGIRFPDNRINEDYAIMMFIYDRCDRIVIDYNKLYYYFQREGSITSMSVNIHSFDQVQNAIEVLNYIKSNNPQHVEAAEFVLLSSVLRLISYADWNVFKEQLSPLFTICRSHYFSAISNRYILIKQKILLSLAALHPWCFRVFREFCLD